nr:AAA family ATPase [Bradyrhizobium yuanmingense]
MGIAADAKRLPSALQSAADVVVRIVPPDGAALRRAISRFSRRSPGTLDPGIAAGLELQEIVAAFRPGQGPRGIVRRLDAARRSHAEPAERVPDLQTAVEYGAARNWALDLAKGVAAYKAGTSDWKSLDRGICVFSKIPGLGKSTFCRSVAQACRIPIVTTSAGEWFSQGPGYLHTVVQRFRAEIAKALSLANPVSALAIEEVDAAVPNRATLSDHAREWHNILISDILATLDSSLSPNSDPAGGARLIILASTNQIELVDPAMLRPGRLEKAVEIPLPDAAGALNIAKFHLEGELPEDDLSPLGPLLAGSTGAEIMYAVRGARRAARDAGRPLTVEDIVRAVLPVEAMAPARLFRMAIHESAHAVAALALGIGAVRHIVLRESGASGGRTVVDFDRSDLTTRAAIEDRVVTTFAGRAAEIRFTGSASTGSGGDPESDVGAATLDVAALHASFSLGDRLTYRAAGEGLLQHIALDRELRERVESDLRRLEARAARLVAANGAAILAVAERLASKRFVDGAEIEAIVRAHPGPAPAGRGRRAPQPEDESLKRS